MDRVREAAVNSHPRPGDPNPTLSDYLQEIDGRGNGTELPHDWGDPTPDRDQEPLTVDPEEEAAAIDQEVTELLGDLRDTREWREWDRQAREEGFRSLSDLAE